MIKKAIEKIEELVSRGHEVKEFTTADGRTRYLLPDGRCLNDESAELPTMKLSSLSGIVSLAVNRQFGIWVPEMIKVNDDLSVSLYAECDPVYGRRPELALAVPMKARRFNFDSFMGIEEFVIGAQSCFVPTENLSVMLGAIAGVQLNDGQTFKDDGVVQTVTVKRGVSLPTQKQVPNPIVLKPYRTFIEIDQPESKFILRVSENRDVPVAGLFEADGGAWRLCAAERIAEVLRNMLEEAGSQIHVIV